MAGFLGSESFGVNTPESLARTLTFEDADVTDVKCKLPVTAAQYTVTISSYTNGAFYCYSLSKIKLCWT